jgi:hypothetical protein
MQSFAKRRRRSLLGGAIAAFSLLPTRTSWSRAASGACDAAQGLLDGEADAAAGSRAESAAIMPQGLSMQHAFLIAW